MAIRSEFLIRPAKLTDAAAILELVKELADFEKAPEQVKTNINDYIDGLETGLFQVIVSEHIKFGIVGMVLFFPYFSTWGGKTMYLEDFIVKNEYRRSGLGSLLFEAYIETAKRQGAKKLKWQVLDWNETAKSFYKKYQAHFIAGWENGIIEF